MSDGREAQRFFFGPRDRRGVMGGVRAGQLGLMTACAIIAVIILRSVRGGLAGPSAFLVVAVGLVSSWWPIAGRTLEQWLPVVARFSSRTVLRANAATAEVHMDPQRHRAPAVFAQFDVFEVKATTNFGAFGALRDVASGVWTAVISLGSEAFALLGSEEQLRRVQAWSSVLSAVSRDAGALYRLQWIERTLPDRGDRYVRHLEVASGARPSQAAFSFLDVARRSYVDLVSMEVDGSLHHELLLAVSVRGPRRRGRARATGRGERSETAVGDLLAREVATLERRCRDAGISVDGVLSRGGLCTVVRHAIDVVPSPEAMSWPWPVSVESSWSSLCTDGTWHATYWIAEWPRSEVGSDFLLPLLVGGEERRTVALVMAPVPVNKAVRAAERARTAGAADAELRYRHGFSLTARHRREHDAVTQREGELAEGHAGYRFSGYVAVTAPDRAELERACGRVEQAAALSHLEVHRLFGVQAEAFCRTLPTGRGCG